MPISDEAKDHLRAALAGSQSILAALAAEIAGRRRIADLAPDLIRAFNRSMTAQDKGCQAKIAIVDALNALECEADDAVLRGIRHVQMEPAFGGQIDTAANLRAGCAVMLANTRHSLAGIELTNLLVDPEVNPRRAAVKALAHLGTDGAEMVIRLKALVGDGEPDIVGECFVALMSNWPQRSMSFVKGFLESPNLGVAEQAAIALGQSHESEAFDILRERWENNMSPDVRRMLLLPIALLRRDEAFEFLVEVVRSSGSKLAASAVTALGIYADGKSRSKIHEAVTNRNDPLISEAFTGEFASGS